MLASMRAELLALRKWPMAWGLLLVTPVLVLFLDYIAEFIFYLALTPADDSTYGAQAQNLAGLLPSQFNIIAVSQFTLSGAAPFIVLGAIMAGGDWGRGTIATSLLQRPGRIRTFGGQALALALAVAASVLATFAVAAAASEVISTVEARSVNPILAALPGPLVIAQCVGVALLIALTYGMLGLFLGTVCRSGAGAIAVALLWTLVIEDTLYDLALDVPHGILRTIADLTPASCAITLTGLFGTPGGGATSQNYLPVSLTASVVTMVAYMAAALALTMAIRWRRDAVAGITGRLRLRRAKAAAADPVPDRSDRRPATGVLAALRAELLVMRNRPAVWTLILVLPFEVLINSYFSAYVLYVNASSGVIQSVSAPLVLDTLMPKQYLSAALSGGFGRSGPADIYLAAMFMLLGALIGGSDWEGDTIRTALLQGPGRLRTCAGQALAVAVAVAVSVVITFVLAAVCSAIVALDQTGSLAPAGSQFPPFGHLAAALAAALVLGLAYAALGLTLGTWLRSATAGIGVALFLAVIIQPALEYFSPLLHGVIQRLYDILPDAATNTLVNLDGNPELAFYGASSQQAPQAQVAPVLAFLILCLYAALFLAIPALLTRRRDIL